MNEITLNSDGIVRPACDANGIVSDGTVTDLDVAVRLCNERRVAVQAGGAYGVWPLRLSHLFEKVYTFEPDWLNFRCIMENCAKRTNIIPMRVALGEKASTAGMRRAHQANTGSGYLVPGTAFPVIALDSFGLAACDFLCLDIEGYELAALRGAVETIRRFSPVIMVEAKPLKHMAGYGVTAESAVHWLEAEMDYGAVERIHRDTILVKR